MRRTTRVISLAGRCPVFGVAAGTLHAALGVVLMRRYMRLTQARREQQAARQAREKS